jgi:metallopeptidase MepB
MNGYNACLYSYLFSEVFLADMFDAIFAKDPMNPKEGRRYRYAVLAKGGSEDEAKILENFLGRKQSSQAFYMMLGLGAK